MGVSSAKSADNYFPADRLPIFLPKEQQIRRIQHPYAAVTHRYASRNIQVAGKRADSIPSPVAVRVFENLHPVASGPRPFARILDTFSDPNAPTIIERHRNRIDDLRLARHQLDAEPL